jgi:hypothetical protein
MTKQEKKLVLQNPIGNCFLKAFELISYLHEIGIYSAKMVHGIAAGQGRIEGIILTHGWVEIDDHVLDFSNGSEIIVKKESYYEIGKIDESQCKKYSYDEALEKSEEDGFFRPWGFPTDEELNSV